MKKCLIWGNGADYEKVINQILFEIEKKNIEVVGIVVKGEDIIEAKYDGFDIVRKEEVKNIDFDYIVITSSRYFAEIRQEIEEQGIDGKKVINGQAFSIPHFDFKRYCQLIDNPVTILSDDCWGGVLLSQTILAIYNTYNQYIVG